MDIPNSKLLFLVVSAVLLNADTGQGQVVANELLDPPEPTYVLRRLNLIRETITISGFSAGSSMATQFHIAHSNLFRGVALFSQAFYRCGPNSLIEFGIRCSKMGYGFLPYKVEAGIRDAKFYEKIGLIDPLTSLKNQKVFIWIGNVDEYVPTDTAIKNKVFYEEFVSKPQENIKLTVANASHLFPTENFGSGCRENAESTYYLGNCSYSGAAQALTFLLPNELKITETFSDEGFDPNRLKIFNQSEFYKGSENISKIGMGTRGYIYIPKVCEDPQILCHLHFNFHGCNEWPLDIALQYIVHSGFLPIAENNAMVMIFPLTTSIPTNYNGCWDFFSYTGSNFATKHGQQIQVVHGMLQRLIYGS